MKVGAAVLGLHIVALVAFSMTQGCITTESKGSGRGAGAKHKGPWKHEHKGKTTDSQVVADNSLYTGGEATETYDPVIIESGTSSTQPTYVAPPPTSYQNAETYIVQKGDILSRLAVEFDTTTQTLVSMNNLSDPDVLYVGQELRVPAGSLRKASSSSSSSSKRSVKKGGEYVIQPGDTLSGIAVAAGVSIDELRSLNNTKDDKIFAGETLDIPAGGSVPTNTQKSKPKSSEPVEEAPKASEPATAPMAEAVAEDTGSMQVDAVMDHVVYPDETLDEISRQYGVSKSDIMRLNNISDESAVKEGLRLRIPITE